MIEVYWLLHWDNEHQMFIAYPKSKDLIELSDKSLYTLLDNIRRYTVNRRDIINHYGKDICIYYYIEEEFMNRIHILEDMTKFKFKVLAKFVVVWFRFRYYYWLGRLYPGNVGNYYLFRFIDFQGSP